MSYTSENILDADASLKHVKQIVELLGFVRISDGLSLPNRTDAYRWMDWEDYRSFVGVDLDIYRDDDKPIRVATRSTAGRSYWDLVHQNKTIKLLRDVFGGHFETDAGRNRYWRPEGDPAPPMAAGCYLARWRLNNALIKPKIYLSQRGLDQPNARSEPSGLSYVDEMNPRLFSNNMMLPYAVAVWEDYFRSTFVAILRYASQREVALKRANLNQAQLERIASDDIDIEDAVADSFSFQRPSIISRNFKLVDSALDLGGVLKRPYRRRKQNLFESIEAVVERRNEFVHTGQMDLTLSDSKLKKVLDDFEVSAHRCYKAVAMHFDFRAGDRF